MPVELRMPSGARVLYEDAEVNGVPQKLRRVYPQYETLKLEYGDVIVLVGPNGSGKSWLLQESSNGTSRPAEYVAGHRNISLQSPDYAVPSTKVLSALGNRGDTTVMRARSVDPELELRARFQRLVDLENDYNYRYRKNPGELSDGVSPVDHVNRILDAGGFRPRLTIAADGLKAQLGQGRGTTIDQLSDGERAALLLCAIVVCAPSETVLLLDEPERHLNPAIARRFLTALFAARRDLVFVLATHDLILAQSLRSATIYVIEGFEPPGMESESFVFRVNKLIDGWDSELGEAAARALLGGRKKVLFTEGTVESLDEAVYGALYPAWDIRPAGGCPQVISAVKGLRATTFAHHADARGLIDRDHRSAEELKRLERAGIFAIPASEIECLLCRTKVISLLAATRNDKLTAERRAEEARKSAVEHASQRRVELAARLAEWHIRREVGRSLPGWTDIVEGNVEPVHLDAKEVVERSRQEIDALLKDPVDFDALISRLPIRATGIPRIVANAIGFASWSAYKDEVLHHLRRGGQIGVPLLAELTSVLPNIEDLERG